MSTKIFFLNRNLTKKNTRNDHHCQDLYGGGLNTCDFVLSSDAATDTINTWVSNETEGLIPQLFEKGMLTSDTRLVITNALYLDAEWKHKFKANKTYLDPFTQEDGSTIEVETMHQAAWFKLGAAQSYRAISLPYLSAEGDLQLAMRIYLPNEGITCEQIQSSVVSSTDLKWESEQQVELSLPRFELEHTLSLSEPLQQLGLKRAFDGNKAELGQLAMDAKLAVQAILQKIVVRVDKEGTEAAAATGITVGLTSIGPMPKASFVVDRPFLFDIVDQESGMVFFIGRVQNL